MTQQDIAQDFKWPTSLQRSNRTRTSTQDVSQIAKLWASMSDKQRSRRLGKMTPDQRQQLKQAIKKHPVTSPQAQPRIVPG